MALPARSPGLKLRLKFCAAPFSLSSSIRPTLSRPRHPIPFYLISPIFLPPPPGLLQPPRLCSSAHNNSPSSSPSLPAPHSLTLPITSFYVLADTRCLLPMTLTFPPRPISFPQTPPSIQNSPPPPTPPIPPSHPRRNTLARYATAPSPPRATSQGTPESIPARGTTSAPSPAVRPAALARTICNNSQFSVFLIHSLPSPIAFAMSSPLPSRPFPVPFLPLPPWP